MYDPELLDFSRIKSIIMKIAFIGLGIMGSRMARNLSKSSASITVYNRTIEKANALKEIGVQVVPSVTEAVADADIVFSMLSTPEVVKSVFVDDTSVLKNMKKGAIWADCSTVNPSFNTFCAQEALKHGVNYLDTPVAGSKPQAENAELVFFIGGNKMYLDVLRPFLETMSKKVIHVGDVGKGSSYKMIVNSMLAQSMAIYAEAVAFGRAMNIDETLLLDVLPNLIVSAPFLKFKAPNIAKDNYEVQFPLEWMHKDLHLASITAYEHKQILPTANAVKEQYAAAVQEGWGRLDFSSIAKYFEKANR